MNQYIGAIDQGTTSSRFILFDFNGLEVGRAQMEHDQILPAAGWVEHNPEQIVSRTKSVVQTALAKSNIPASAFTAVGITNQRETTVVWDVVTGKPFYNAIVWQDTRTADIVIDFARRGYSDWVRQKTGLPLSTYFSATKLMWLLKNIPDLRDAVSERRARFGTIDTWLIWNLTGGTNGGVHVTDVTNASRTLLMNLETLQWDPELLELFDIPREMLPEICPSCDDSAYGSFNIGNTPVRICGNVGDQQAALMGQACFEVGEAKNTYGTGNFILMNTGERPKRSHHGLLTTSAYQIKRSPGVYALEGSIAVTGSAVQWLRDQLRILTTSGEIEILANKVTDSGGVYFVPAFSGLFAPYWRTDARGAIVGLTRFSTKEHLCRATLESICFQTRDVLEAMNSDSGVPIRSLKVDGGACVNDTLMQMQADISGLQVIRPRTIETTALGAAYAAGLATGFWKDIQDLKRNWQVDRTWEPQWSQDQRETSYSKWKRAVEKSMNWEIP